MIDSSLKKHLNTKRQKAPRAAQEYVNSGVKDVCRALRFTRSRNNSSVFKCAIVRSTTRHNVVIVVSGSYRNALSLFVTYIQFVLPKGQELLIIGSYAKPLQLV